MQRPHAEADFALIATRPAFLIVLGLGAFTVLAGVMAVVLALHH